MASVAVLVALIATSCATSARTQAGAPPPAPASALAARTANHTFVPYDASGALTVAVRGHQTGHCWSASIVVPDAHTYRCFAGNLILDPCFAPSRTAKPRRLACVADPWSPAVVLRLTKPLPPRQPTHPTTRPWALVLASGAKCVASSGTVPSVGGINLPYHCSDDTAAALVDRPGPQLRAYDAAPNAASLHQVAVRAVWRG